MRKFKYQDRKILFLIIFKIEFDLFLGQPGAEFSLCMRCYWNCWDFDILHRMEIHTNILEAFATLHYEFLAVSEGSFLKCYKQLCKRMKYLKEIIYQFVFHLKNGKFGKKTQ